MPASTPFKVFNKEVLFASDPVVTVDHQTIAFLKGQAEENERKRIRLCAHKELQDLVHEMFIVHTRETYVRPHKHLQGESFHVIEGCADVVVFDELGGVSKVIRMGEYTSGRPFYYRLSEPCYHTLLIQSDVVVFHETKQGPFTPSDTTFAPWAPDGRDAGAALAFIEHVAQAVGTGQA